MMRRWYMNLMTDIIWVLTAAVGGTEGLEDGNKEGKIEGFLLGNSVGANVGDIVSDPPPHAQHACEAVSP
jgi:hypothetical protein